MLHGGDIYDKNNIEYDFSVNLNPLGCPSPVREAVLEAAVLSGRYPDYYQRAFKKAVAKAEGVEPSQVIGGNGASELLMSLVRMLKPKSAVIVTPGFSGYSHVLNSIKDCESREYALSEDKDFKLDSGILKVITDDLSLVMLGNPNNPTGRYIRPALAEKIFNKCLETGTYLIVDESFHYLTKGSKSMVPHIDEYKGLFVISSYTKLFSLPGARIGYCICAEENITGLKAFLPEWNMSIIAQRSGELCARLLRLTNYASETQREVSKERDFLSNELVKAGVRVFPSDTCFIMFYSKLPLYDLLLEKGILIRDLSTVPGLKKGYYRIAVKSHEENVVLVDMLKELVSS